MTYLALILGAVGAIAGGLLWAASAVLEAIMIAGLLVAGVTLGASPKLAKQMREEALHPGAGQ